MWSLIAPALQSFLPTVVGKVVEVAASKKAWAAVLTFLHVANTPDTTQKVAAAIIGGAYCLGQGIHDAAKAKADAAQPSAK